GMRLCRTLFHALSVARFRREGACRFLEGFSVPPARRRPLDRAKGRLMRILLINIPHPPIGSRIPDDHLPPLGLLSIGGPLIDDGHDVTLLDAEFGPMPLAEIVARAVAHAPEAVLFGHSGSTSGHPVIAEVA